MPDPIIHSSSWTGPPEEQAQAPSVGSWASAVPANVLRREQPRMINPAVRIWARLVALLFFSPLLLWAGWRVAHAGSDELWTDHREWLFYWTYGVALVIGGECYAGRPADPTWRSRFVVVVFVATMLFGAWYSYQVLTAHATAVGSTPERTYELYRTCGENCGVYLHQRMDGTTIEGVNIGPAGPTALRYTLVQRLNGEHGFSWVRVLDRSPPPEHEISWPIRGTDCFSRKPIAELHG